MKSLRLAVGTSLISIFIWLGHTRTVAQAPSTRPTLNAHPRESLSVYIDAVSSRTSKDLTSSNLMLIDNGERIPQGRLRLVPSSEDAPSQLIFVIDAINSSLQDTKRSEAALVTYLRQGNGSLAQPTTVLIVSDSEPKLTSTQSNQQPTDTIALHQKQLFVHRIPATMDGIKLAKELEAYTLGLTRILQAQGDNAGSERVRLSLEALSYIASAESSVPGAKVAVWLSPGWPFLAKSEAKSSEHLFDSLVYFSDAVRSARMIIDMIDPQGITNQDHSAENEAFLLASRSRSIQATGRTPDIPTEISPNYYLEFVKGVRTPQQSNPNDLCLQVLAIQSGGTVSEQNNDLKGQLVRSASDVQNLLSVSYDPQRGNGVLTFHEIQLKAASSLQPLRARTGFYTR